MNNQGDHEMGMSPKKWRSIQNKRGPRLYAYAIIFVGALGLLTASSFG